jgi:hypothetical protein
MLGAWAVTGVVVVLVEQLGVVVHPGPVKVPVFKMFPVASVARVVTANVSE